MKLNRNAFKNSFKFKTIQDSILSTNNYYITPHSKIEADRPTEIVKIKYVNPSKNCVIFMQLKIIQYSVILL